MDAIERVHDELPEVRRVSTAELTAPEVAEVRRLLWAAFVPDDEGFSETDWEHALGGLHFVLQVDGAVVTHAAVVERVLYLADQPVRTGYVEAVATLPLRQGGGFGSRVMREVSSYIRENFEFGALGTGRHAFYERLGWLTWRGPSSVRTADGTRRTPDDDGYIRRQTTAVP